MGAKVPLSSSLAYSSTLVWVVKSRADFIQVKFALQNNHSTSMNPILLMVVFHGCGRAPSTVKISPLAQDAVPTSGEVGSFKVGVQLKCSAMFTPR